MTLKADTEEASLSWFELPLGQTMLDAETAAFNRLLPARYYPIAVQVFCSRRLELAALSLSRTRFTVSRTLEAGAGVSIAACPENMPFGANSIDLLVLPHVLDLSDYPHDVLREAAECVVPEGVVAISAFNPRSMLGVARYLNWFSGTIIDDAELYSAVRVRDWLALLGFEVFAGEFLFFRPPFIQNRHLNRFRSLETAGARWWPAFGSVYVLVAKKKELGMRMDGMKARKSPLARSRLFQPLAQR